MTKNEFVDRVAENSGLGKGEAAKAVDAVLESIEEVLKRGGDINFTGFGKFTVADRSTFADTDLKAAAEGCEPADRREDTDRREQSAPLQRGLLAEEGSKGRLVTVAGG